MRYSLGYNTQEADRKMSLGLLKDTINPFNGENIYGRINNGLASLGIGTKLLGEKLGLFKTDTFTTPVTQQYNTQDREFL